MIDLSIKDSDRVAGLLAAQAGYVQKITDLEIINAALRRLLAEAQKQSPAAATESPVA